MKMKYVTVKSGFESVGGAYLGQFVSNGTSTLDEVAAKMCKDRPAVDEPEAKLAVRALAAEIREQVGVNLYRVNAGAVSFEPAIAGSFPSMDAAPGPENVLYVNIVASDALKREIAAIVPTRDNASAIAVKIDNVEDLASHDNKIVGTKEFVVTGFNLSARQDGEGLSLLYLDGTSAAEVTVKDEDGMGQRVNAQLAAPVASGTYLLQLTTHGYSTPDAEAESYTKKVQVVYVAPPVQAPTVTDGSFDTELTVGSEWSCDGTHLKGCKVHLVWVDEATGETKVDKTLVESHEGEDTHFAITLTAEDVAEFDNAIVVKLTFTNAAGSDYASVMLDKGE